MIKRLALIAFVLLLPSVARAQTGPNVGPNDSFAWNQDAPSLSAAQGFAYKYYLDGATTGSLFSGVTCTGTAAPYTCQVRTPTFANGAHSMTITAASASGESPQSVPFQFVSGNPPTTPNNIRVVKGTP